MIDPLEPIKDLISRAWKAIDSKPTTRWGTVVTVTPLTVLLDPGLGDPAPAVTAAGALTTGQSVFCVEQNRRITVIGKA